MQDDAARGRELDEERRRVVDRQRLERHDVLARQAKRSRLVTSTSRSGAPSRSRATWTGSRREVLEVVEEEERRRSVQRVCDGLEERPSAGLADADRARDRVGDELRVRHGGEPDEMDGPVERGASAATSRASRLLPAPPGP